VLSARNGSSVPLADHACLPEPLKAAELCPLSVPEAGCVARKKLIC
jgi:hypothetical protein